MKSIKKTSHGKKYTESSIYPSIWDSRSYFVVSDIMVKGYTIQWGNPFPNCGFCVCVCFLVTTRLGSNGVHLISGTTPLNVFKYSETTDETENPGRYNFRNSVM